MTKHFALSTAGYLVVLVMGSLAWAQSETPEAKEKPDQSANPFVKKAKPADQGSAKASPKTKDSGKDSKDNPFKPKPKSKPGDADMEKAADENDTEKGKPAGPNWKVNKIRLAPYAGGKYSNGKVNIEPTKGMLLIEATFEMEALRSDDKAVDRYLRTLRPNDRKQPPSDRTRYRVLEAKNVALRDSNGKKFAALWNLEGAMRTTTINYNITPNSQSQQTSTSGSVSPNGPWFDAEQTFITRVTTPFNQPPITEYAAFFTGMLRTDEAFSMKFLFSVPASADLQSLKLVVDSDEFSVGE